MYPFLATFKSVFKSFTMKRFIVLMWTEGLKAWKCKTHSCGRRLRNVMDKPTYHISLFLFNFQVGDNSFDLPEANVLIQVKCAQLIMSIEFEFRQ